MPAALCARALQDQLVELEAANMSADFERNGDSFKEYFKRWDRHGPDRDGSGRPAHLRHTRHSLLHAGLRSFAAITSQVTSAALQRR